MTLGEVARSVFGSIQRQLIDFGATSFLRAIPGIGGFLQMVVLLNLINLILLENVVQNYLHQESQVELLLIMKWVEDLQIVVVNSRCIWIFS